MSKIKNSSSFEVLGIVQESQDNDNIKQSYKEKRQPDIYIPSKLQGKPKKEKEVKTLFITQGNADKLKSLNRDIDIIGLPSFVEYINHAEKIAPIIELYKVENVILVFTGKLGEVTKEAIERKLDTSKPFFDRLKNIEGFKEQTSKKRTKISETKEPKTISWYYYNSDASLQQLLLQNKKEVIEEMKNVRQRKNNFFTKFNFNSSNNRIIDLLGINEASVFYGRYQEIIGFNEFSFNGEYYQHDKITGKIKVTLPAEYRHLRFVGNDYYRIDEKLDAKGNIVGNKLYLIKRTTLRELYPEAKDYLKQHYYKGFTNIPNNYKWNESHLGYYNRYTEPRFEPKQGDISNILKMVKHVFGEDEINHNSKKVKRYELGLDYMQLLITEPTQQLPILILYSKERETGKSTFPKFLKAVLGTNAVKVGNKQFDSDFNEVFADKSLVWCDETLLDRKAQAERIKDLSTSKTILVNPKGTGQYEIPFFAKFIFTSNNPRMVYVDENSVRFWIHKVGKPEKDDPFFDEKLQNEIPALLHYLENRKLATDRESRMHFHHDWIKTDGLEETVRVNEPQDVTNIREGISRLFEIEENKPEIKMPMKNIIQEFLKPSTNAGWVKQILNDHLKVKKFKDGKKTKSGHYYKYDKPERKSVYITTETSVENTGELEYEEKLVKVNFNGRPYVFDEADFIED